MKNSVANGNIKAFANSKEVLWELKKVLEAAQYSKLTPTTCFDLNFLEREFVVGERIFEDGGNYVYYISTSFVGEGKETYENTVKRIFLLVHHSGKQEIEKMEIDWDLLEKEPFKITFNYVDVSESLQLLCQETCSLVHDEATEIDDFDLYFNIDAYTDYRYCLTNLSIIAGYDFWGYLDTIFKSDSLTDEKLYAIIKKEKPIYGQVYDASLIDDLIENGYQEIVNRLSDYIETNKLPKLWKNNI